MKFIILPTLTLGLLGCLVGCGNKSPADTSQQANNDLNAKGNVAIQNSSYTSDCTSGSVNFAGVTFPGGRTEYDLSDLDFTKKQLYYTDACKTSAFVVQEKGKVAVVANSGAVPSALEEDFNFEHTTVTIMNDTLVKAFNLVKACGFSDWALNVEKDVSVQASQVLCPGKPSPRTAPELVLVQNNNLYMGANTNQDVSKGRPTQIDLSLVFRKQ